MKVKFYARGVCGLPVKACSLRRNEKGITVKNGAQGTPATQRNLHHMAFTLSHAAQAMMPPTTVRINISTINHFFPGQKFSVQSSNLLALVRNPVVNRMYSILYYVVNCKSFRSVLRPVIHKRLVSHCLYHYTHCMIMILVLCWMANADCNAAQLYKII